ncbi:hypothetical protein SCHPADRAFT_227178 [Schizopora paradoxa]|uniref:Zn(2)-C6 fungal-type domain-containing protein n=1 Tax=Schizopora paradoxa TaxID=27342 RepID=A0A0H2RX75_9AGAM|nr:hypothetical protein SCHPADRAFT_227178 [Schizopora paradoxa]
MAPSRNSPPSETANPRALAARARCLNCCVTCKRYHRKCDNGSPCGTCIQKKRKCVRETPSPKEPACVEERQVSPMDSDYSRSNASSPPNSSDPGSPVNTSSPGSWYADSPPSTPSEVNMTLEDYHDPGATWVSELASRGWFRITEWFPIVTNGEQVVQVYLDLNQKIVGHAVIGSIVGFISVRSFPIININTAQSG